MTGAVENKTTGTPGHAIVAGVPEGLDALVLSQILDAASEDRGRPATLLHIARDDRRLVNLQDALRFFAPQVQVITLPAWDCVPYDRISPNPEIISSRVTAFAQLVLAKQKTNRVVLTTVNAALQKLPPRDFVRKTVVAIKSGLEVDTEELLQSLQRMGYLRTGTVMEHGEFAVRGGIVDVFPPGHARPVRIDFFGDQVESLRRFDPATQRTAKRIDRLTLLPISEMLFDEKTIARFRTKYVGEFGAVKSEDALYDAISNGARYPGMEHWLPLFHEKLETVFDYVPDAQVSFDHLAENARAERLTQIKDHYDARANMLEEATFGAPPYKALPPRKMFLTANAWDKVLSERFVRQLTPFSVPDDDPNKQVLDIGGRTGRTFAAERADVDVNVYDAVVAHIRRVQDAGKRAMLSCWTSGARERFVKMFSDHGIKRIEPVDSWADALQLPADAVGIAVLGLEQGFETPDVVFIGEQDILGDRLVRPRRKSRKASDVLTEASSINVGDLIVHADHGIGRFDGLKTIEAMGAPHDCLELVYKDGDKLYLPVENIELLSRYGSDMALAQLDRLGSSSWQNRKAKIKKKLLEMAGKLIKIAALRELKVAPKLVPPDALYSEFCARFPYEETEDQLAAVDDIIDDLATGRPMDRLVCGDVGFGKTEVALRSAFAAVMNEKQVAVVVPTTLLARQHYQTFVDRFEGVPVKIAQASRLVPSKQLADTRRELADGTVDIVVGTHALLADSIEFRDLGLLVIDEEQRFGVKHKERLKEMRQDVHVLTLSATPIPRTLQLAMSGVRELSLITTPPVDRLAVRSYVTPFDPVILREALLRERYRGGQSFYVCPRISDLDEVEAFLQESVPELRVCRAHGQMSATQLETVMNAFYDGEYDVLLSTTIVESGLDIPTANTLIIHRADMFGLAQLYQLRGRVGRSKTRAYAYFTLPVNQKVTDNAGKRLKVLQSLDTLGAGFTLASHDLDLRGAGNLLGEEQSGQIKEVGFELYQSMLEEAVASLKDGEDLVEDQWSPQISLGTSVLIPESYVTDLQLRLSLYRRLSALETREEIDEFAGELHDRFGELPEEVVHLLDIVEIKAWCRRANIESVEAGPKGGVLSFRNNTFPNPPGLLDFVDRGGRNVKLQPDHKVVYREDWDLPEKRLPGVLSLVKKLTGIAEAQKEAA